MLMAASAAYRRAKAEQEIEFVWTGPSSKLIATRKTAQALLQVIDAAKSKFFMTSFVVYKISSIMKALEGRLSAEYRSPCYWKPASHMAARSRLMLSLK
jgi:cardiolipin synthase A/B